MDSVFIDIRRLIQTLVLSLFLPLSIALSIDIFYGYMPFCTIFAVTIFIPLSTVIVIRTVLSQMDNMLQEIAPIQAVVPVNILSDVPNNVQSDCANKKIKNQI